MTLALLLKRSPSIHSPEVELSRIEALVPRVGARLRSEEKRLRRFCIILRVDVPSHF